MTEREINRLEAENADLREQVRSQKLGMVEQSTGWQKAEQEVARLKADIERVKAEREVLIVEVQSLRRDQVWMNRLGQ